jgi:hypothetical protein
MPGVVSVAVAVWEYDIGVVRRGVFARHPKRATGFALMIPIRREDLGLLLE